ncbi:hypothetical protein, partial [Thiolapillus sp.]|uniref:hypothetical protein n=1 Tax=Thiolapillus sp. TaxID=2017437 RepID=UPI003AF9857F
VRTSSFAAAQSGAKRSSKSCNRAPTTVSHPAASGQLQGEKVIKVIPIMLKFVINPVISSFVVRGVSMQV